MFVDWPHALRSARPVFDLVGWAPSVVLEGGPPPEDLLARYGPSAAADPDVVTDPARRSQRLLRVALAASRRRPGCRRCAAFQAAQGEVALAWLRRRTGW